MLFEHLILSCTYFLGGKCFILSVAKTFLQKLIEKIYIYIAIEYKFFK